MGWDIVLVYYYPIFVFVWSVCVCSLSALAHMLIQVIFI